MLVLVFLIHWAARQLKVYCFREQFSTEPRANVQQRHNPLWGEQRHCQLSRRSQEQHLCPPPHYLHRLDQRSCRNAQANPRLQFPARAVLVNLFILFPRLFLLKSVEVTACTQRCFPLLCKLLRLVPHSRHVPKHLLLRLPLLRLTGAIPQKQ